MAPRSQHPIQRPGLRPVRLATGIAINLAGAVVLATQIATPAFLGGG
jgi:hypothetical protein